MLQDQETSDQLTLQTDFAQTFRTGKAFDHLDLWVANWDGGANDSVYDVTILDESGVSRSYRTGDRRKSALYVSLYHRI